MPECIKSNSNYIGVTSVYKEVSHKDHYSVSIATYQSVARHILNTLQLP